MYLKNLKSDIRVRLSDTDIDFLRALAQQRDCTLSVLLRDIIGQYRRDYMGGNSNGNE